MASIPIVRERVFALHSGWRLVEICERGAALLLLVAALPVLLVSGFVIWILSGRGPFIAHKRVGWNGSVLWMLKLRTMWDSGRPQRRAGVWIECVEDEDGPGRKHPSDSRVPHAFARFCRRHSIDELPQLWHVVRGQMVLIGPRPMTDYEIRRYYHGAAKEILRVKPGIAGLWQASGRNRLSYEDRKRLDLEFVRSRSLKMYSRICIATIAEIWSGANTW